MRNVLLVLLLLLLPPAAYAALPPEEELARASLLGVDRNERGAEVFEIGTHAQREELLADLLALGEPGKRVRHGFGGLLPRGTADLLSALKEIAEGDAEAALAILDRREPKGAAAPVLHFTKALALAAEGHLEEALVHAREAAKSGRYAPETEALVKRLERGVADLDSPPPEAPKPADVGCPAAPPAPPKKDPFAEGKIPELFPLKIPGGAGFEVRIGLSTRKGEAIARERLRVRAEGPVTVAEDRPKGRRITLAASEAHTLRAVKGGKVTIDGRPDPALRLPVELTVKQGGLYLEAIRFGIGFPWESSESRLYRGAIRLEPASGGFRLVNRIALERYLAGVLPSEMPHGSPDEALKAQAVAARSEATRKVENGRHAKFGYDLCDDVCCQAYRGAGWEKPRTNEAIERTAGLVLLAGDRIVDAIYGACCGGHSQSSGDLTGWGRNAILTGRPDRDSGQGDGPFGFLLEGREDACSGAGAQHRWFRVLDGRALDRIVRKRHGLSRLERMIPVDRNPSGHLEKIALFDGRRHVTIEKELKIRDAFTEGQLRSSKFLPVMIEGRKRRYLVLIGGGFGHGVGMCQEGAIGMAKAGRGFKEILARYYPGASVGRRAAERHH